MVSASKGKTVCNSLEVFVCTKAEADSAENAMVPNCVMALPPIDRGTDDDSAVPVSLKFEATNLLLLSTLVIALVVGFCES